MNNKLPSIKIGHSPNDINSYHRGGLSHLTDCTKKDNNLRSSTISQQGVNTNHASYPTGNSYLSPYSTFDQPEHPPRESDFCNNSNYSSSMASFPGEKPSVPSEYPTLHNHSSFVSSNANSRRDSTQINYDSDPCKINYEEYAHQISPVDKCPSIRSDQSSNHSNTYHCGSLPHLTDYCTKNNNSISSTISQERVSTDQAYYPTARDCYLRSYSTFDQWGHPLRERNSEKNLSYLSSMADQTRDMPSVSSEYSTLYNHSNFVSSEERSRHFPTTIINYESPPCMINYDERFVNRTAAIRSLSSPIDKNNSGRPLCQARNNNFSRPGTLNGAKTRDILGGKLIYSFPEKLFQLLDDTYKEGKSDIVSFLPDGRAFVLYNKEKFMTDIVPKYFRFSKLTSFQRQLSMYGFRRINSGKDAGAYYHMKFLREKPSFCTQIKRISSKEGNSKLDLDTARNTIDIYDTAVENLEASESSDRLSAQSYYASHHISTRNGL